MDYEKAYLMKLKGILAGWEEAASGIVCENTYIVNHAFRIYTNINSISDMYKQIVVPSTRILTQTSI